VIDMKHIDPLLLRVEEAARLTGIGRSLAYEKVSTGEWPSISIGRARRIPLAGLRRWIEQEVERSTAKHDREPATVA